MKITIRNSMPIALKVFALLALTASSAFSQIIVTRSAAAPSTDILIQSSTGSGTGAVAWMWTTNTPSSDRRDQLQQFQYSSNFTISAISVFATGSYAITANSTAGFSLALNTYSSTTNSTVVSNVATFTGNLTRLGSGNQWWTFDIPDTALTANTIYGYSLSLDGPVASSSLTFQTYTPATSYPSGGQFETRYNTGSAVVTSLSSDQRFIIQGVIPEPSSIALMLGGVAGILLLKRSRKRQI